MMSHDEHSNISGDDPKNKKNNWIKIFASASTFKEVVQASTKISTFSDAIGFDPKNNWFFNFLNCSYYIPINIPRFIAALLLSGIPSLSSRIATKMKEIAKNTYWFIQALNILFIVLPFSLIYVASCLSLGIINFIHPENLYTLVQSIFNLARFMAYLVPCAIEKIACAILDKIYNYDKNIQKSGLRKAGALFIGLFRFPFYLLKFVSYSVLFPFGEKKVPIFGSSERLFKEYAPQDLWYCATKQIFGEGFITNTAWYFGQTLRLLFSAAGWGAMCYFAFPTAVQSICTGLGVALPPTLPGLSTINTAGAVAATVGTTSVLTGNIAVEIQKSFANQKGQDSGEESRPAQETHQIPPIKTLNDTLAEMILSANNHLTPFVKKFFNNIDRKKSCVKYKMTHENFNKFNCVENGIMKELLEIKSLLVSLKLKFNNPDHKPKKTINLLKTNIPQHLDKKIKDAKEKAHKATEIQSPDTILHEHESFMYQQIKEYTEKEVEHYEASQLELKSKTEVEKSQQNLQEEQEKVQSQETAANITSSPNRFFKSEQKTIDPALAEENISNNTNNPDHDGKSEEKQETVQEYLTNILTSSDINSDLKNTIQDYLEASNYHTQPPDNSENNFAITRQYNNDEFVLQPGDSGSKTLRKGFKLTENAHVDHNIENLLEDIHKNFIEINKNFSSNELIPQNIDNNDKIRTEIDQFENAYQNSVLQSYISHLCDTLRYKIEISSISLNLVEATSEDIQTPQLNNGPSN